MNKRTFYVVGGDRMVANMFVNSGHLITQNFREADAMVFTGGADVSPFLYGERMLKHTQTDWIRDRNEMKLVRMMPARWPKIGICRGGQFLNVASGGALWQHVDGHADGAMHLMRCDGLDKDKYVEVTSTHHQMMIPTSEGQVLGRGNKSRMKMGDGRPYYTEKDEEKRLKEWADIEVVYYEHTNALCYQPHPEYGSHNNPNRRMFFEMVDNFIQFKKG